MHNNPNHSRADVNTSDYDVRYPLAPPPPPPLALQASHLHSSEYLSSHKSSGLYSPTTLILRNGPGFDYRNNYATEAEEEHKAITTIRPPLSAKTNTSTASTIRCLPLLTTPQQQYPIFPPSEEMKLESNKALLASEASFRVIYAGNVVYRIDKKLLSKSKRAHFVLTNNQLLLYKSFQKARNEINSFGHTGTSRSSSSSSKSSITIQDAGSKKIDNDRVFLNLSSVYAIQLVATSLYTFRIEYLHPQSGQALYHTLTADNEREAKQWVHALRKTVCVHHPRIISQSITGTERYAVLDRMSKQSDTFSDSTDQVKMYKVVFKEKRYKMMAGGDQASNKKEVFLPVMMAIGKFSFYLLPLSVMDDEYLKTVERDRFGVLSIQSIRYDNMDDTVIVDVKQVGKRNRQLAFASTFCEEIIQYLYRSIESIIPGAASGVYEKMPNHIQYAHVVPYHVPLDPEDEMTGHDDDQVHRFNSTLRAYTAAMNINKSRFNFTIMGPLQAKSFTLLPPHEVGGTPSNYEKHELLAMLRTIQSNHIFVEICLAHCSLNELDTWTVQPNHGWTFAKNHHSVVHKNVLSNEIYSILTNLHLLRKLDLTDCSIGKASSEETTAIATIGTAMLSGKTQLSRIRIGKNNMTKADLSKLIHGIKEHKKSIKELHLNECGLEKDMTDMILRALFETNSDQIISLDLSSNKINKDNNHNNTTIDSALVEKMMIHFKRLEILRMRGHYLFGISCNFMLESSRLRELDLGGSKMNSDNIARLCKWIQTPSFNCIESLHLGDCSLNGKNVCDILVNISQSGNRSMHLNLEHNPIMKELMHMPKLYSAILHGEGPVSVSFARIEWDDSTLRKFLDCLRDNQTITRLNLSDISMRDTDEISEETVRMLTLLFERNAYLSELKLHFDYNKATRVPLSAFQPRSLICRAIVQALPGLRHNSSLRHLDISHLYIEDAGAFTLARVLMTNKNLQSILIENNNISIDGYQSLTKVIQEHATQVIDMPTPRKDLRSQQSYLVSRIKELIIFENEAQFFLIHTTATKSNKQKSKTHTLGMIGQERKQCELALQNFEGVIHSLGVAVQKNAREQQAQNDRNMKCQMQAQAAAQELVIAQVRLQGRLTTGSATSIMGGTQPSVVGSTTSSRATRHDISASRRVYYESLLKSASRLTYQDKGSNKNSSNRRSVFGSEYSIHNGMVSPTLYSHDDNYNHNAHMHRAPSNDMYQEFILSKPHSNDDGTSSSNTAFLQSSVMMHSPTTMHLPVRPSIEYTDPYHNDRRYDAAEFSFHSFSPRSQQEQQQPQPQQQQQHKLSRRSIYNDIDDPGFISDFGYFDDFEQDMISDPHYLGHPHQTHGAGTCSSFSSLLE